MKTHPHHSLFRLALGLVLTNALSLGAATLYWDADGDTSSAVGGTGSWSSTSSTWRSESDTGSLGAWADGSSAVFSGTATYTVTQNGDASASLASVTKMDLITVSWAGSGTASFEPSAEIDVEGGALNITSVKLAGSNGFTKTGSGSLNLFSAAHTSFTGAVIHDGGTLQLRNADSVGSAGSITVSNGSSLQFLNNANTSFGSTTPVDVTIADNASVLALVLGRTGSGAGTTHTLGELSLGARTVNVRTALTTSGTSGAVFAATVLTGSATVDIASDGTLSLGALYEVGGNRVLTKTGTGTLTLRGAVNDLTGLALRDGNTEIGVGNGSSASFDGGLELGYSGKTTSITLDADTVTFASSLELIADATIDFGNSGATSLAFGESSGETWSGTLYISNYGNDVDSFRFGSSSIGLTATQLAGIVWLGLGEGGGNLTGAYIDTSGYVTPHLANVPEPSTWALTLAACAGAMALVHRRRGESMRG